MNCLHCKEELPEGANFCFKCGFDMSSDPDKKTFEMNRQEVAHKEDYGGYLLVGGWINIIAGTILALIFFSKDEMILGIACFISGLILAWLYFGLHKVILKISRIEKTLESRKEEG